MENKNDSGKLASLAAACHLGITSELLFQYTKPSFAKASGLRALMTLEESGRTMFSITELDAFDAVLSGPWPSVGDRRPAIPKAILDHLRAESYNQCARCGSGIGVDTAHVKAWAESKSHHHANLIRLCSACHREHDAQFSLSTDELISIKNRLVERTRANLTSRIQGGNDVRRPPRSTTNFVGRESELLSLTEALQSGRSVIITGVGGIGKTELLVRALGNLDSGRSVLWIDVEKYRRASDMLAALQAIFAYDGIACPAVALPAHLDALQACVVFDGIERANLDDIDEFEDTLATLYSATAVAQFVATSQIVLHKFPADTRLKVGKLDESSSRRLLESYRAYDGPVRQVDLQPLLEFCQGHALTLKLATALMDHYGGPLEALRAVQTKGATVISLPGRKHQNRNTSLELCLQTAYDAVSTEGRQLLWTLSESPAGLLTNYLEGSWLGLSDPIEALAELRRWHFVDLIPLHDDLSRTQVLSPVRMFAIGRARKDDRDHYEAVLDRLVHAHAMMVAVLEVNYDDPSDTPYVLKRYGDELPNLLHVLNLARANPNNTDMLFTAVSIVRPLMRYFFVLRLPEEGASVMRDAAELALSAGHHKSASGLVLQLIALAQRAGNEALLETGLALADRLECLSRDGEVLADIAMARGIAARETGDYLAAESYAREALKGYQSLLRSSVDDHRSDPASQETGRSDQQELHNDVASALGLLGFSLLSRRRYQDAAEAYRHSLHHQRGTSVAVNRGQTLHQIGNCESHLGHFSDAVANYRKAAEIFHFVGMEEYLSNALGELGYALLDVELEHVLEDLDPEIIDHGLVDLAKDTKRVFDPARPLDHSSCISIIRKLFGSIALLSLMGQGRLLNEFCVSLGDDVLVVFHGQLSCGARDREEGFPLLMIDTALRLGLLVAEGEQTLKEHGDISRETIGEMLRTICNAHDWARDTMRVVDWFSTLLTRRWRYQGASPERIRGFIKNYDNDVVDYFDLRREGSTQ